MWYDELEVTVLGRFLRVKWRDCISIEATLVIPGLLDGTYQ